MKKLGGAGFRLAFLICCVLCLTFPRASGAQQANQKAIVRQARQAYYNLRNEGLLEFQCTLTPDWEALLADQRKADPATADAGVRKLQQLHFSISLGPDGSVKITHNDIPSENQEMAKGLAQIFSGMEQMTTGFFQTWSPFMLNAPFPEVDSVYQLEEVGLQHRLSYKEGTADVVTTMGKDFAISSLNVTTPEFDSTIQPQFTKTPKGLLLSGYEANYQGQSAAEATQLKVHIEYQEVSGLQLVEKLDLRGTYGGSPFQVQVTFSGCQATKR